MNLQGDMRAQRHGWAPGSYLNRCCGFGCKEKSAEDRLFIGDKRAIMCADCAYALPEPVPVDRVAAALAVIMVDNPDKVAQAKERPQLIGWFIGQVMKKLNGSADPQEVYAKAAAAFGVEV